MAKHPGVNHFRSGVKNPNKEVVVYDDGKGNVKVTVVDWLGMRVIGGQISGTPTPAPEAAGGPPSPSPALQRARAAPVPVPEQT